MVNALPPTGGSTTYSALVVDEGGRADGIVRLMEDSGRFQVRRAAPGDIGEPKADLVLVTGIDADLLESLRAKGLTVVSLDGHPGTLAFRDGMVGWDDPVENLIGAIEHHRMLAMEREVRNSALQGIMLLGSDGKVRAMNRAVRRIFAIPDDEDPPSVDILGLMSPDSLQDIVRDGERSFRGGEGGMFAYRCLSRDGRDVYIEAIARPVRQNGEDLTMVFVRDVTERNAALGRFQQRGDLISIVARLSERMVREGAEDLDRVIDDSLDTIGDFRGADRCYLFSFDRERGTMSNTHEWCSSGTAPQIHELQDLPLDMFPWWMGSMEDGRPIVIPRVADLPAEASTTRRVLEEQGIRSLMAFPLMSDGGPTGFLGVDFVNGEVDLDRDDVDFLETVVGLFSAGITHKRNVEAIRCRDAILDVLNRAAADLLVEGPKGKGVRKLVAGLGMATDADRAWVYRIKEDGSTSELFEEWCAEGVPRIDERFHAVDLPSDDVHRGFKGRSEGREVMVRASAMRDEVRERMDGAGPRSFITVPVMVDGSMWGLLGLHDHRREREWSTPMLEALEAAAGIIGLAVGMSTAQEELEASRARMEMAVRGTGIGVWEWDLLTDRLSFSEEWLAMFGFSGEDVRGLGWWDLVHPADEKRLRRLLQEYLGGLSESFEAECRIVTKQGHWKWGISMGIAHRDGEGRPTRMFGVRIDLSERRFLHDSLRRMGENLDLVNRVSRHDVVNQVTAINGYADLLEGVEGIDERAMRYLGRIKEATEAIVHQLRFAEEYQMMGVDAPMWLSVAQAVEEAFSGLESREVSLEVDVGGLEVVADRMLPSALRNLFENSLRHGGGVSTISVRLDASRGELVVADDGAGIPSCKKELIFEHGYGSDHGYGLCLVREILRRTSMDIHEEGREGARFVITLPEGHWRCDETV